MRTILLIMIGLSAFLSADFIKSGDVVTDRETGLQWQDNNETNSIGHNWQESIDYCESLTLDTHDDWRLPNINELRTLIDRSKMFPVIKGVFEYIGTSNFYRYWSSTSVVGNEDNVWLVGFDSGDVFGQDKNDNYYVRCVRDGQ